MNCCKDWIPIGNKHGSIAVPRYTDVYAEDAAHDLIYHHPGKYMFEDYDTSLRDMTINARPEKRRKVGAFRLTTRSQRK